MKKFMFVAMVVASAGVSQAASITWSAPTGAPAATAGLYVYAMTGTAADQAAVFALLDVGNVKGFQSYYAGLDAVNSVSALSLGADSHVQLGSGITSAGGFLTDVATFGTPNSFVNLTHQGVFYVIFDNADPTMATQFSISQLVDVNLGAGGATPGGITWANWGGLGVSGNGTWLPIPEPTTMVVMAAGIAALGLRRRFRK